MKVLIIGDVHRDFGALNELLNKKRPDIAICCGDFGYWPRLNFKNRAIPIIPQGCKVYWCDGNHEDFQELNLRTTDELWPNVIYKPRGSTLTLPDGRNIMFMGGGLSVDKHHRCEGIDWFPEEVITNSQISNIDTNQHIDIMISHTCPMEFEVVSTFGHEGKYRDPCRAALSYLLETFMPQHWYFGHWHNYMSGKYNECEWTGLDHSRGKSSWWQWLN